MGANLVTLALCWWEARFVGPPPCERPLVVKLCFDSAPVLPSFCSAREKYSLWSSSPSSGPPPRYRCQTSLGTCAPLRISRFTIPASAAPSTVYQTFIWMTIHIDIVMITNLMMALTMTTSISFCYRNSRIAPSHRGFSPKIRRWLRCRPGSNHCRYRLQGTHFPCHVNFWRR